MLHFFFINVGKLRGGQPCISCGEFITTLGKKDMIYTFGKTIFAIKNFHAYVKNTDQNFHPIGLEFVKILYLFFLEATCLKLCM